MTRVLFVEGKDEAALREFARRLRPAWRLLARPEQGLFLLETTDSGREIERAAAELPDAHAWTFDILDEHPGG